LGNHEGAKTGRNAGEELSTEGMKGTEEVTEKYEEI
jgi:hypothetical protein